MLVPSLLVSLGMVILTVLIHFRGLSYLIAILRGEPARRFRAHHSSWRQGATILGVVFGLFFLHTIEISIYALLFMYLEIFRTFEAALFYSAASFTTLGLDIVVERSEWRLVPAIEAISGFILIGWSTAFLVSVTARMGLLEATLEQNVDPPPPRGENSP
ncbi:MAG: ion channel [Hyphomonadaceae bacterium]